MNRQVFKYRRLFPLLLTILLLAGCGNSYKNQKPFAIYMNGKPYTFELDETFADIGGTDSVYPQISSYCVYFPAKLFNAGTDRGFILHLDPRYIKSKESLRFSARDSHSSVQMIFSPVIGRTRFKNGLMEMTTTEGKGKIHAYFDILEPREGGRIKGIIYEAVMEGFFVKDFQNPVNSKNQPKPARIEIYNFALDTRF